MSKSTASTTLTAPPCPSWCRPEHCRTDRTVVRHSSAPVTVATSGATFTLTLATNDETTHPDEWGQPPYVDLEVTSNFLVSDTATEAPLSVPTDFTAQELADLSMCLAEFSAQASNPGAAVRVFTVAEVTTLEGRTFQVHGRSGAPADDAVDALRELVALLGKRETGR